MLIKLISHVQRTIHSTQMEILSVQQTVILLESILSFKYFSYILSNMEPIWDNQKF